MCETKPNWIINDIVSASDDPKFDEIFSQEIEQAKQNGLKLSAGNIYTLVCKSFIRRFLGDEAFEQDLTDLDVEEAEDILMAAGVTIKRRILEDTVNRDESCTE